MLVLRKILAKIWPIDVITTTDPIDQLFSTDTKPVATQSTQNPNEIKRRSKTSTMTNYRTQPCSTVIEQSSSIYEPLYEQNSGHISKPTSLLFAAKAKPCFIKSDDQLISNTKESSNIEQNYPQHLNPFNDGTGK